jgi:hypothetical protein
LNRQLALMLTRYGFTGAFDIGSMWENTRRLRARIESGEVCGPRIRSTGPGLIPPRRPCSRSASFGQTRLRASGERRGLSCGITRGRRRYRAYDAAHRSVGRSASLPDQQNARRAHTDARAVEVAFVSRSDLRPGHSRRVLYRAASGVDRLRRGGALRNRPWGHRPRSK